MKAVVALVVVIACSAGGHEPSGRDTTPTAHDPEVALSSAFIRRPVPDPPSLPAIDPANATRAMPAPVAAANALDASIDGVGYVQGCELRFQGDPTLTGKRDPERARTLLAEGDAHLVDAAAARRDALASIATDSAPVANYIDVVVAMIDAYRRSLDAAPYDPRATRGLAIAYHLAYRKGCALGVLKRLAMLERDATNGEAASAAIDEFAADPNAFAPYRKAALAAVGR